MTPQDRVRKNQEIRISPLRVINQHGEQVGVIERDEALRMAEEAGLDLVEVQADIRPPLVKIMDFGKFRYEQSKRKSAQAKKSKANETKEVRLGRSVKIDQHDVAMRVQQARKFLLEGYKVMFVQRFRGREMAHPDLALDRLNDLAKQLEDVALVQSPPKMNGRQMNMLMGPDKRKIEAIKRREAKEKGVSEGDEGAASGSDDAKAPEAKSRDSAESRGSSGRSDEGPVTSSEAEATAP